MTNKNTTLVTDHAEFIRASKDGDTRYYPSNGVNPRERATAYLGHSNFDYVRGYAVYDTTISTSFAVRLYATKAEADDSIPKQEPPPAPTPHKLFPSGGINKGNKSPR